MPTYILAEINTHFTRFELRMVTTTTRTYFLSRHCNKHTSQELVFFYISISKYISNTSDYKSM